MTELKLTLLPDGQISLEMEGDESDIAVMLCRAMVSNVDIATIVLGTIPTFLDEKKFDRAGYCKTVMNAQGLKK